MADHEHTVIARQNARAGGISDQVTYPAIALPPAEALGPQDDPHDGQATVRAEEVADHLVRR